MFYEMVKRVAIDFCEYIALGLGVLFFSAKMIPFVTAAISLGYVNGQTISYLIFSILLILLPIILLCGFKKHSKRTILRWLFYSFSIIIVCGTIFDMFTFKFFIGYTFKEGDAIFVNLLWNMPNIGGIILSAVVAAMYYFLGKQIKRNRRISFMLYVATVAMSHIPTFVYTFFATGSVPRDTYLQKSLYVIAIQLLILGALALAATSRTLWRRHIWN